MVADPNFDRPTSDIAKGPWEGSKPLVIGLGIGSILLAILVVVVVVRARLKAKRGEDLGPISSRGGRAGPPSSRPPPNPSRKP